MVVLFIFLKYILYILYMLALQGDFQSKIPQEIRPKWKKQTNQFQTTDDKFFFWHQLLRAFLSVVLNNSPLPKERRPALPD